MKLRKHINDILDIVQVLGVGSPQREGRYSLAVISMVLISFMMYHYMHM